MANDKSSESVSGLLDPRVFGAASTVSEVVAAAYSDGGGGSASSQLAQVLQQLESVSQAETETIQANTQAINQNTTEIGQRAARGSAAGQAGSAIASELGLGTELSPLITGIAGLFSGLFGGGGSQENLPGPFLMPPSANVNAGINESTPTQPFAVDYAAGGQPRGATASGAQITVQVQAMDSQSFLDHSEDIAMAVRQAMLQSTALNDVIREV